MPISNCKRCGRMYNRVRRDICPSCVQEEDTWFLKVRDYLHQHRNALLEEVVEATGVDFDLMVSMIQDGRLILADFPNVGYPCEGCGASTRSGRLCGKCSKAMTEEFSQASQTLRERREAEKKSGGFFSRR